MTIKETEQFKTQAEAIAFLMQKGRCGTYAGGKEILHKEVPREAQYQTAIMKWIKANVRSAFVWKDQAGQFQVKGIPDILAVIDGHLYGFEVKRPFFGKVSEIQMQTHMKMRAAGARVHVVTYASQVEAILRKDGIL